jgi:uncharacterized repeat protein (TIGR01451 family)
LVAGHTGTPGDSLRYVITSINTGNEPDSSVVVTDTLPSHIHVKAIFNGGSQAGNVVSWTPGVTIPVGGTVKDSITVYIDSTVVNGSQITNIAAITPAGPPGTVKQLDSAKFTASNVATLFLRKSASELTGNPGDTITYTLKYGDTGTDSSRTVSILDTIPSNTTYAGSLSGTGVSYDAANNRIIVSRALIPQGDTTEMATFRVVVNSPLPIGSTNIKNSATETASNGTTVTSSVTTVITGTVNFATSTKTDSDLVAGHTGTAGDSIKYKIAVINTGNQPAVNVVVTDTLPAHIHVKNNEISGSGTLSGSVITWPTIASLAPNSPQVYTVTTYLDSSVTDGSMVTNTGHIVWTGGSQSVTVSFTVSNKPLMTLTKTVDQPTGRPGDTLTYTMNYKNIGTSTSVTTIAWVIPAQENYVPGSITLNGVTQSDAGDVVGSTITVVVGDVTPGTAGVIKYKAIIK